MIFGRMKAIKRYLSSRLTCCCIIWQTQKRQNCIFSLRCCYCFARLHAVAAWL